MALIETVAVQLVEQVVRLYGLDGLFKSLRPTPGPDERVAKLASIQADLAAAIDAVRELQENAQASKREAEELESTVNQLRVDKEAAEELVKVPEEAFARLLSRATAKGRGRGLAEGVVIGLVTGSLSSLLVWYVTKG